MNKITQTMTAAAVEIKERHTIHGGFCHIEQYYMRHQRFAGTWTPYYNRELMLKPKVAAALPYDPNRNQVVLIEQFRLGALGYNPTPWLLEIVAGLMDQKDPETDIELIQREMREETGLTIIQLLPIYEYLATPGCSTEKVKLFCAQVDATKVPEFCGLASEHEDIKTHVIPAPDAFAAVAAGQINNAIAIIALQWLQLHLAELKNKWR